MNWGIFLLRKIIAEFGDVGASDNRRVNLLKIFSGSRVVTANMKRSLSVSLAILATSISSLLAQQAAPAPAPVTEVKPIVDKIDLKDGDTLVFLGDSITHQCLYTQYVEDYFYTRYPKTRIRFHNAGVGGDRAINALNRFDADVASFKPKYVTVLLGMNDGTYTRYEQGIFDTYQKDMNTVLDRIAAIGATAIPMTPTMHDARAARARKPAEPRDTYYNGVLALYGAWLREQAQVRGLGFVDMYSPLNNITIERRKQDPKWTMIADAVHPGPTGQVVMAAALVNDMVPRSGVSFIALDTENAQPKTTVRGGKLTELKRDQNGTVSFTFTADALPWVLPPDAAEGYKLSNAGHKFSAEKFAVQDLQEGQYELRIDAEPVGNYSNEQLASGIELQGNNKTPQYQQALQVALLNKRRNDEAMHPLRDRWSELKSRRRQLDQLEQSKSPELEAKKQEFEKWYAGFDKTVADLIAKAQGIEDEIYQANQPKARRYELVKVQ